VYMFMYICVYIELMAISISLVDVTMIDLWKNKKIMVVVVVVLLLLLLLLMMMMMMKDAFEDKRNVSSKFKPGETGKEGRKEKQDV